MNEHSQSPVLPDDDYNQELIANVHPADWVNPKPTGRYNIVVIGAGTAGLITAGIAASLGAKVALIEKEKDARLGGTCGLRGRIPTKALLNAAHLYQKAGEF